MNIHGDIFATLDATGTVLGTTQTGPFGETINGQTLPVNGATGVSYSYVGKHLKATETQLTIKPIQMGARVYLPNIGRFTSVDPVQGGTPNPYTYVTDPVNDFDLSGQWSLKNIVKSVKGATKNAGKSVAAAVKKITTSPQGSGAASSPIAPKSTLNFNGLKKEGQIGAKPGAAPSYQTTQLSGSLCIYICGELALVSDGGLPHLYAGYVTGEFGGSVGIGGGPGKVTTGWSVNGGCSAGILTGGGSIDSGGANGYILFNIIPLQVGCGGGGGYTF